MESLTPIVNYILEGEFPKEFTTGQRRKLIKQASMFLWLEGSLYQKGNDLVCRRVPSTSEIPKILKGLHEEACGGHFSHGLTLKKVLLVGYVWPSMHADVQHSCRSCHNCQVNGNKRLLYGPRQAVIANGPFEKWGIDAMGPLPRTSNGKLYILVAIDYMTRWVEAQSIAKVNEKIVSKFVYTHICCRFGTPLEIVSDNGPGFRRGLLTEVCEELKISHRHSTPYYPQSNGLVEKANGIIARIIRKMVESKRKRWDNFLDGAIWAYRTTYRDATQFTPFHLVYGQEALQPIELNIPTIKLTSRQEQNNDEAWIDRLLNLVELEWQREATYHCYEKEALQLKDKLNEGIKDKEIKEKSLVLRYNNAVDNRFDANFERRWEGPFIVKKAFTGGYYQLTDLNGREHPRKVNGYWLKPYLSRILPAIFETKQVSKKTKKFYSLILCVLVSFQILHSDSRTANWQLEIFRFWLLAISGLVNHWFLVSSVPVLVSLSSLVSSGQCRLVSGSDSADLVLVQIQQIWFWLVSEQNWSVLDSVQVVTELATQDWLVSEQNWSVLDSVQVVTELVTGQFWTLVMVSGPGFLVLTKDYGRPPTLAEIVTSSSTLPPARPFEVHGQTDMEVVAREEDQGTRIDEERAQASAPVTPAPVPPTFDHLGDLGSSESDT
ncbi:hypothetical protein L7F22_037970 [Adiantum nelumboides]|nr:hypothetical protein [Adiantum nelumboides]